jgi:hypothetical protein
MGRQARAVHISRSVSTFASVALVPACDDQPRRTPWSRLSADALGRGSAYRPGHGAAQVSTRERAMADKSPRHSMSKKSSKSIKEKRLERKA